MICKIRKFWGISKYVIPMTQPSKKKLSKWPTCGSIGQWTNCRAWHQRTFYTDILRERCSRCP